MKPAKNSYRHLFLWGDPDHEEKLEASMKPLMHELLGISEADLKDDYLPGTEDISGIRPCGLADSDIQQLISLVGKENVVVDDVTRAGHAYGKTYLDLIRARLGIIDNPPDAVVYPRHEEDVIALVAWCHEHNVPLIPFGGHSSVTRGVECPRGGISLDVTRHMNQVVRVNKINATVTVQPGMYGPALERYLNNYSDGYTCGHFPQSFEFSTVGGWVAARGAGQQSANYGKIESMVLGLRVVTPRGLIETEPFPARATGPDINQIFIGSEGILGVITSVTMKIRKFRPGQSRYFSFLFKTFENALETMRETMQGEFGFPSMFRISDPEETEIAFRLKDYSGGLMDYGLRLLGYKPLQRCLLYVSTAGDADHGKLLQDKISTIAKRFGALPLGASAAQKWLEQRYSSAYLRDPLMDKSILVDTLETAVTWENLMNVWRAGRSVIKSRDKAIAMVHLSHPYENGANLYFTFMTPMVKGSEIDDYLSFHRDIVTAIQNNGGSLSHHHGIGRLLSPWMEKEVGSEGIALFAALKNHCDPHGIMNPGGILGLE